MFILREAIPSIFKIRSTTGYDIYVTFSTAHVYDCIPAKHFGSLPNVIMAPNGYILKTRSFIISEEAEFIIFGRGSINNLFANNYYIDVCRGIINYEHDTLLITVPLITSIECKVYITYINSDYNMYMPPDRFESFLTQLGNISAEEKFTEILVYSGMRKARYIQVPAIVTWLHNGIETKTIELELNVVENEILELVDDTLVGSGIFRLLGL